MMMIDLANSGTVILGRIQGLPGWVARWNSSESRLHLIYSQESVLPGYSSNSHCAVLFDGIIQNRHEILQDLREKNFESDADIVLHAYMRWGENTLHKVKGVYLLAIFDSRQNSLLCARDRCGTYPFFYAKTGNDFLFSTSTENLIRHPGVSNQINRSQIVDFMAHRRPVPDETIFSAVKRILPGHALRISKTKSEAFCYWYSFPPDGEVDFITDLSDTRFDREFESAVARCMMIGQAGIFLSGGLDSVSIASVAADLSRRNGNQPLWGLSLGFPHPDCDESNVQKSVAKGLGFEHLMVPLNDIIPKEGLFWWALELGRTWSQPMWNVWQPLYIHLGRRAKELGCSVIMTGTGGDEWLNVSPTYIADLMRFLNLPGLCRIVRNMLRSYQLPGGHFLRHLIWSSGFKPLLVLYATRFCRRLAPDLLHKSMRERVLRKFPTWVASDPELKREADQRTELLVQKYLNRPDPKGRYGFYSSSFVWYFIDTVVSMELEQQFEAGEKTAVPVLQPFYDSDLIELLLRISPEVLQQGGMEKGLVRNAVARRFPDLKFERKKKISALGYWQSMIHHEAPDAWKRIGGASTLIKMGIIDKTAVESVVQEAFTSNSAFKSYPVWDLLCTETWLQSRLN
jgi:asparagine synthase (glutamine-hydrolysing)